MTTIADFRKLFEGLPDDTPILVFNEECVISDCSPHVEETVIAGDMEYYWRSDDMSDDDVAAEGYDPKLVTKRKAIWINGDEP